MIMFCKNSNVYWSLMFVLGCKRQHSKKNEYKITRRRNFNLKQISFKIFSRCQAGAAVASLFI